jgi:hypothetical protein
MVRVRASAVAQFSRNIRADLTKALDDLDGNLSLLNAEEKARNRDHYDGDVPGRQAQAP